MGYEKTARLGHMCVCVYNIHVYLKQTYVKFKETTVYYTVKENIHKDKDLKTLLKKIELCNQRVHETLRYK